MRKHRAVKIQYATGAADSLETTYVPAPEAPPLIEGIGHEDIARLAYGLWLARGCPYGSPEEDWFRAEKRLQMNGSDRM